MARYSAELLRELRNDIPIQRLLNMLGIPAKISEGYLRLLCPLCSEYDTATNPRTNLARCFRCAKNFNPSDLVMIVERRNFVDAVEFLLELRDRYDPPSAESR